MQFDIVIVGISKINSNGEGRSLADLSVDETRLLSVCMKTFIHVMFCIADQGYGRGGTPIFTGVFEPIARVDLYPTDEDVFRTWFAAT